MKSKTPATFYTSRGVVHLPEIAESKINGYFVDGNGCLHTPEVDFTTLLPLLPNNNRDVVDTILYVNGIKTTLERHFGDMQALANSGAAVIGLHDSTAGGIRDALAFFSNRYGFKEGASVKTVRRVIHQAIERDEKIHLAGHSRGAQVISLALLAEYDRLLQDYSEAEIKEKFSVLSVETFGGAAPRYPNGPCYLHMDNIFDPVSKVYGMLSKRGLSRAGVTTGENAVAISLRAANLTLEAIFNSGSKDNGLDIIDRLVHNPRSIYFSRRIPFAHARERGSCELKD